MTDQAPPSIAERIVADRLTAGRLLLALDFDGTLAPIVERPEQAAITDAAARAVRALASRDDTVVAIVSGRGLEDVRARVREDRVYYAGNHGYEIEGPELRHRLPAAERLRPELGRIAGELRERLPDADGFEVEDKGVTLSVHYRRATPQDAARRVDDAVADVVGDRDDVRITKGKRVVEVRPALDWHKGRALEFLIDTLFPDAAPGVAFIGDDVTDEDGFRAAQSRGGVGVLVGGADGRETAADARVESTDALVPLLRELDADPAVARGAQ